MGHDCLSNVLQKKCTYEIFVHYCFGRFLLNRIFHTWYTIVNEQANLNAFLQRLYYRAWGLFASIQAWGTLDGEFIEANSRCEGLLVHAARSRTSVKRLNCRGSHWRRIVTLWACAGGGNAVIWHCKARTNVKMSQNPVIGVNVPFKLQLQGISAPHDVGCLKCNSCAPSMLSVLSRTAAARHRNASLRMRSDTFVAFR